MSRFATSFDETKRDIAMEPQIFIDPLDVDNELQELGLTQDALVQVVRIAESERALCTSNDPIGFASYVVYARAGRELRNIFVPQGWEKDDSNNQCAIRNPKTKVRIVPCNFNEAAGDRLITPTNKSPKGEVSRKKSMCNRTSWIPGIIDETQPIGDDGYQTWVLGVHIDDERTTSAELSLPVDFDGKYFTQFASRIILLDGTDDGEIISKTSDVDEFEVIDIEIKRK